MATFFARKLVFGLVGWGWLAAAPALADAPQGRYTFPQKETVFDTRTKLTWQRAVSSQQALTWEAAKAHCAELSLAGSGWRLPTRAELLTLVDPTRYWPAIDASAFPDAPAKWFWTSTTSAVSSGYVWVVDFGTGMAVSTREPQLASQVRCVR